MSKGENEAEDFEVAIKSKGGDCWHYVSSVVLDGNSLRGWYRCSEVGTGDGNLIRGQISVQQDKKEIYAGLSKRIRVYTQVCFSKSAYMWKTYLWSVAVIPWKLCLWFWTMASRRTC